MIADGKYSNNLKKNFKDDNKNASESVDYMLKRNSTSKNKLKTNKKTRKKREELSVFASKSIKKEKIKIIVEFK